MSDVYSNTRQVASGNLEITVAEHGPSGGPPVLMIHGFPDSARLWRHQVPALADSGYRVLAPDLRGYGRSNKPHGIEPYQLGAVAGDLVAVLDEAGVESAHVVGHDWGAALAWYLAITQPDRVRSLVALSVGHPTAFRNAGFRQLEKTWYMLLFQFKDVAESWLSDDDWHNFKAWTGRHPELDNWIQDLERPGALTASLGIYRANMGPERLLRPAPKLPPVTAPVMGVWSSRDLALVESQMTDSAEYVAGEFRYERIDDAGHWIPLDAPDRLSELLLGWLENH